MQGSLSLFQRLPPTAAARGAAVPVQLGSGDDPLPWAGSLRGDEGACPAAREHAEYGGDVARWGADHLVADAAACCAACAALGAAQCNVWVFCADAAGCSGGSRARGECWLKRAPLPANPQLAVRPAAQQARSPSPRVATNGAPIRSLFAPFQASGPSVGWTSGALFAPSAAAEATAQAAADAAAVHALRYAPGHPRVFLDVEIDGVGVGRLEMQLFTSVAPRAANNFLAMCRGDAGTAPAGGEGAGKRFSYEGAPFYRVLDQFICQSGVYVPAVTGGAFDDDAGGLALRHTRAGLLSMANSGRNTNTNHFSILMAPAPHLDGAYTIFGEVVKGMAVARAINALATPSGAPTKRAVIVRAGQLA